MTDRGLTILIGVTITVAIAWHELKGAGRTPQPPAPDSFWSQVSDGLVRVGSPQYGQGA